MDTDDAEHMELITGLNADGQRVTISVSSVLALVPDPVRPHCTRLHGEDGVVLVEGDYEDWIERLAASWTSARS